MTWIAWFLLVVGVGVLGLWAMLVTRHEVPEIEAGDRAIWFHIAAEVLMGVFLIAGGIALLSKPAHPVTPLIASVGLGALVYSAVNSAGYYANQGKNGAVTAFGLLALGAVAVFVALTASLSNL